MPENGPDSGELRSATRDLLASRPVEERKALGQYFTPKVLRRHLLSKIDFQDGARVLEPAVGTGEFLADLQESNPDLILEGWDIDPVAAAVAEKSLRGVTITVRSALEGPFLPEFDYIIGNPPYFEMPRLERQERNRFRQVISGRPNIFALFFQMGIERLKPGGLLAYVVPPSMNSGSQFAALRAYLTAHGDVEYLKVFTDASMFEDAQTAVQVILIRKRTGPASRRSKYVLDVGALAQSPKPRVIFTEHAREIRREYTSNSTLWQLGYEAVTGSTVWNQHKDSLRDTAEPGSAPLLWSHNITTRRSVDFNASKPNRPQHIITTRTMTGPAIAVSRIVGSVGSGSLRCALVPRGTVFAAENHVNIIRPRPGAAQKITMKELLDLLRAPEVNDRIRRLTGNTQIGSVELTHFVPLSFTRSEGG